MGFPMAINQSEKNKAFIINAFNLKSFNCGNDYTFFHTLHECGIGKRYGRNGAHTSCIRPGISVSNSFIILGFRQNFIGFTVGNDKYG